MSAWYNNEFLPVIVYGPHGHGKTCYAVKVLAEVLGYSNPGETKPVYRWDVLKKSLLWHPKEFVERLLRIKERERLVVWDDAGMWLHSLDWNNVWVKSVCKYLNVVRTDLASIIFTTPLPTWVVKRLRGLPQALTVKITKNSDKKNPHRRLATGYKYWLAPDMKKSGVRTEFVDFIPNIKLPDEIYKEYLPIRLSYADEAKNLMRETLDFARES